MAGWGAGMLLPARQACRFCKELFFPFIIFQDGLEPASVCFLEPKYICINVNV